MLAKDVGFKKCRYVSAEDIYQLYFLIVRTVYEPGG